MRRHLVRARASGNLAWSIAALIISIIAILPVIAIFVLALQSSGDTWPHLIANVLPGALRRTLVLMAGVGLLTLLIGTGTAWLVTMYRFPGRGLFQWLLLLPLAMPTYIIAYCFLELFDYSGALQTGQRAGIAFDCVADHAIPERRVLVGVAVGVDQDLVDLRGKPIDHVRNHRPAREFDQALVDAAHAPAHAAGEDQAGDRLCFRVRRHEARAMQSSRRAQRRGVRPRAESAVHR